LELFGLWLLAAAAAALTVAVPVGSSQVMAAAELFSAHSKNRHQVASLTNFVSCKTKRSRRPKIVQRCKASESVMPGPRHRTSSRKDKNAPLVDDDDADDASTRNVRSYEESLGESRMCTELRLFVVWRLGLLVLVRLQWPLIIQCFKIKLRSRSLQLKKCAVRMPEPYLCRDAPIFFQSSSLTAAAPDEDV